MSGHSPNQPQILKADVPSSWAIGRDGSARALTMVNERSIDWSRSARERCSCDIVLNAGPPSLIPARDCRWVETLDHSGKSLRICY